MSVCLSVCLFVCLTDCLSVRSSVRLSVFKRLMHCPPLLAEIQVAVCKLQVGRPTCAVDTLNRPQGGGPYLPHLVQLKVGFRALFTVAGC